MALLRFRYAYIIVAVLRSTALRRVVDGSPGRHRRQHREWSSSLHPTSIPFVLALSGLRALRIDVGAPPTAQEQSSAAPLVRRGQETVIGTFAWGLTGRSTSTPGAGRYLVRSGRAKDPQDFGVPNRETHRSARPGKAPRRAEVRT